MSEPILDRAAAPAAAHAAEEPKVTTLELFFDLVFVFAVTQVTTALVADLSWMGLLRGMLTLAAVWWAWVAYSWLTNAVYAERVGVRLSLLAAMAAMLVVALCVPGAFGAAALPFAVALSLVRAAQLLLFAAGTRDPDVRRAVGRLAPGVLLASALLVGAAFASGAARLGLWAVALVLDYSAPIVGGTRGWHVSPAHFVERHGLIVIIALGEAIISLGVGAAGHAIDAGLVAGAALGLVAAFGLWWVYFDVVVIVSERVLREAQGDARARMARDSFSYLHLPLVAGIVLFALGAKKTLEHVGDPLTTIPAVALGLGPALVLATLSTLRKRHVGGFNRGRLVAAAASCGAIAIAQRAPAVLGLAAVTATLAALITYEAIRFRHVRARVRGAAH